MPLPAPCPAPRRQTSGPNGRYGTRCLPFLQPNKLRNGHKGLRVFCSEDEQSRGCWLAAFRLFKVGLTLRIPFAQVALPSGTRERSQYAQAKAESWLWPQNAPYLVVGGFHSPVPSTCLTSGSLSISAPKYGAQLYKNYQQAQSRHLRPSCVGSPPLVSVHGGISWAWAPRPHPGETWALF